MLRIGSALAALIILLLATSAPRACSLCAFSLKRTSLAQEWERHDIVIYGRLANPKQNNEPGAIPGTGTTEFHIEKVLKSHSSLEKTQILTIDRYIPILDAKAAPKFIAFLDVLKDKPRFDSGRQVKSAALLEYLDGALALRGKDRVEALLYYARFFDHEDEQIADDAFLEFARSTDKEVGQTARKLSSARLRKLIESPKVDAERLSLFAFLLGGCGSSKDAAFLKAMLQKPSDETARAFDGIVGGYIALEPRDGWELAVRMIADTKRPFGQRYPLVRMIRLYHGWRPGEFTKEILRCYQAIVPDGEMADFAIEDLRQWKSWDLTGTILAQWDKGTHKAPIVRRSIVRYALSCPLPEARQFVERIRPQNRDMIRDLEEDLAVEAGR